MLERQNSRFTERTCVDAIELEINDNDSDGEIENTVGDKFLAAADRAMHRHLSPNIKFLAG